MILSNLRPPYMLAIWATIHFFEHELLFLMFFMFPYVSPHSNSKQEVFLLKFFFFVKNCFSSPVFFHHTHLGSSLSHIRLLTFTSVSLSVSFQFLSFSLSDFSRCRTIGSEKSRFEYSQLWRLYLGMKQLLEIWTEKNKKTFRTKKI